MKRTKQRILERILLCIIAIALLVGQVCLTINASNIQETNDYKIIIRDRDCYTIDGIVYHPASYIRKSDQSYYKVFVYNEKIVTDKELIKKLEYMDSVNTHIHGFKGFIKEQGQAVIESEKVINAIGNTLIEKTISDGIIANVKSVFSAFTGNSAGWYSAWIDYVGSTGKEVIKFSGISHLAVYQINQMNDDLEDYIALLEKANMADLMLEDGETRNLTYDMACQYEEIFRSIYARYQVYYDFIEVVYDDNSSVDGAGVWNNIKETCYDELKQTIDESLYEVLVPEDLDTLISIFSGGFEYLDTCKKMYDVLEFSTRYSRYKNDDSDDRYALFNISENDVNTIVNNAYEVQGLKQPSKIHFNNINIPTTTNYWVMMYLNKESTHVIDEGASFPLKGTITSDNLNIVSVTCQVVNERTGAIPQQKTVQCNTKSFDINSQIDSHIKFAQIPVGHYRLNYTATLSDGTKQTYISDLFAVMEFYDYTKPNFSVTVDENNNLIASWTKSGDYVTHYHIHLYSENGVVNDPAPVLKTVSGDTLSYNLGQFSPGTYELFVIPSTKDVDFGLYAHYYDYGDKIIYKVEVGNSQSSGSGVAKVYEYSDEYKTSKWYEQLMEVRLTGNQREDIVNVARSQIGYHEGNNRSELHGNNASGYADFTEYAYYMGKHVYYKGLYAPWCAMFVGWCARQAGISSSIISNATYAKAANEGACFKNLTFKEKGTYTPVPGDLIFFDWDKNSTWDHVGIVSKVSGGYVTFIDGNSSSESVRERSLSLDYWEIRGYGIPAYINESDETNEPNNITFSNINLPEHSLQKEGYNVHEMGTYFEMRGTVKATTANIVSLRAYVYNAQTGEVALGDTAYMNSRSVNIYDTVNLLIPFQVLPEGEYYISYTATDENGKTATKNTDTFWVISRPTRPTIKELQVDENNHIIVSWDPVPYVTVYSVFLVSLDGSLHEYVREVTAPATSLDLGYFEPGEYYFELMTLNHYEKFDTYATSSYQGITVEEETHTHDLEIMPAVLPTCTKTGITEGKRCSTCGEVLVAQNEIPAKGHTATAIPTIPATCTDLGKTEGSKCSVCGEILVKQNTIAPLGHTEVNLPAKEATCTETGLTAGTRCEVCGDTLISQKEIPAKGHAEVIDPAKTPTCTQTGLTEGKHCSVCNEILTPQTEVSATDHTPGDWTTVTEPAIGTEGKKQQSCTACGEILNEETIPALPEETEPETEPVTDPETDPVTEPETQPETDPVTEAPIETIPDTAEETTETLDEQGTITIPVDGCSGSVLSCGFLMLIALAGIALIKRKE